MSDPTYSPKTYRKDGGNTQVVASGGLLVNDATVPGYETTFRKRVTTVIQYNARNKPVLNAAGDNAVAQFSAPALA